MYYLKSMLTTTAIKCISMSIAPSSSICCIHKCVPARYGFITVAEYFIYFGHSVNKPSTLIEWIKLYFSRSILIRQYDLPCHVQSGLTS